MHALDLISPLSSVGNRNTALADVDIQDDVMLKRLDGSDIIPPLAEDEVEEEIDSKSWIIRRALAHRVNLNKDAAVDWDKVKGTEEKSQRAYL